MELLLTMVEKELTEVKLTAFLLAIYPSLLRIMEY